jgi:hypothetical protein
MRPKPGSNFDDVRAIGQRKIGDGLVPVEIKDGHEVVSFAGKKCAVMLRVKSHAVISLAASDRVSRYNLICGGINDSEDILVLQIHVHLARDRIVLWHAGFAVEMKGFNDHVGAHIHDSLRFAPFVGDVELMERCSICASVGLRFGREFLDYFHLPQANDTDCVVARVRRIEFLQLWDIFHAFCAGCVGNGCHHFVRPQVDYICLPCPEMGREQVAIVGVNREIVEPLSGRPGQVELGHFL